MKDPNLLVRDLMFAVSENDVAKCHRALADIERCCKRGQPPVFNAAIAGRGPDGKPRRSLQFHFGPEHYAILSADPNTTNNGYQLHVYNDRGDETARYWFLIG